MGVSGITAAELLTLATCDFTAAAGVKVISVAPGASTVVDVTTAVDPARSKESEVVAEDAR